MTDKDKRAISRIVKEVIKEQGWADQPAAKAATVRAHPAHKGPAVLNVFHAGLRKLGEAIEQVKRIEKTARRSSVYTAASVRARVWGSDLKESSVIRCNLDSIKPEGIEKTLEKSDILILPTFCLQTAAKVARLICDDMESSIVLKALLQNKNVIATNDGFLLCDLLVNEALRAEIDRILNKLEGFGMIFCPTDQLHATVQKRVVAGKTVHPPLESNTAVGEEKSVASISLITAKIIKMAVDDKIERIYLAADGKVTPLARDLAKEYGIRIVDSPGG
jgi:hypothetical protein